jgi:hypothetical protein
MNNLELITGFTPEEFARLKKGDIVYTIDQYNIKSHLVDRIRLKEISDDFVEVDNFSNNIHIDNCYKTEKLCAESIWRKIAAEAKNCAETIRTQKELQYQIQDIFKTFYEKYYKVL